MPEHGPEKPDQPPAEQAPKQERELTIKIRKEKLRKRMFLLMKVVGYEPADAFDSYYTRIWNPLGSSTTTNTPLTINQVCLSLAMSNHPAVDDLLHKIENGEVMLGNFDPEILAKAEVERGIRILDLGCGPSPTFARVARRMGADVYTVDVIPASKFDLWRPEDEDLELVRTSDPRKYEHAKRLREEYEATKSLETRRHLEVDLNTEGAVAKILEWSGGNFDLVTAVQLSEIGYGNLSVYTPHNLEEMAMQLLKQGGVFYYPDAHTLTPFTLKGE